MSDYKPTEHDGLKKDGTPDKRVGTGEFNGNMDAAEAGRIGGQASGSTGGSSTSDSTTGSTGNDYKPSDHDGLTKDGKPDGRMKGN